MGKKYIEQEAALSAVCASCKTVPEKERELCPYKFEGCGEYYGIFALPAADVREVVRGKWINEKWFDLPFGIPFPYGCLATCDACKKESFVNVKRGKTEWQPSSDFCPNCGADMRGK